MSELPYDDDYPPRGYRPDPVGDLQRPSTSPHAEVWEEVLEAAAEEWYVAPTQEHFPKLAALLNSRPSTAPHAEFERQTVEAFQDIRRELDKLWRRQREHRALQRKMLDAMLVLYKPSRWARFKAWARENLWEPGPQTDYDPL